MERHGAGVFSPIGDAGKGFGRCPRLLVPVRGAREWPVRRGQRHRRNCFEECYHSLPLPPGGRRGLGPPTSAH